MCGRIELIPARIVGTVVARADAFPSSHLHIVTDFEGATYIIVWTGERVRFIYPFVLRM